MESTVLDIFNKTKLKEIYNKHLADKNSVGVDGITNKKFSENIDDEVEIIHRKILNGSYEFSLYKEKLILKGRHSNPRTISIPTNRDKLVLKVLHDFLKTTFGEDLVVDSIHSKIRDIKSHITAKKYDAFIKVDIKNFFPSIDHGTLQNILNEKISDQVTLNLVDKAIKQSTVSITDEVRKKYNNPLGVPQGLSISAQLASIYLSNIDKKYIQQSAYHYYRFVDDILILCDTKDIHDIVDDMKNDMQDIKLKVHDFEDGSHKSSYGVLVDGVQFLGYMFKGSHITVRKSSVNKIYNGINKVFLQHYKYSEEQDMDYLYWRLSLKITGCIIGDKQYGWLYFFSYINDQKLLFKLDAHVKRACRRFKVPYDKTKIKKFSRTYYELLKINKSTYIPRYTKSNSDEEFILDIILDIDTKESKKNDSNKAKKKKQKAEAEKQELSILEDIITDIETDIEYY